MNTSHHKIKLALASFALVVVFAIDSYAGVLACNKIQYAWENLVSPRTAVRLLMHWEQSSNQKRWGKPSTSLQIEYVEKDADSLVLRTNSGTSENLQQVFTADNLLRWYRHPLNKSDYVPFRTEEANGSIPGKYSASRSMFVYVGAEFYSFKLGTDHPHPRGDMQPGKADLLNDSDISMRRSEHIRTYDKFLPRGKTLTVLTEVLSVATDKNGFSVRDLRPLQDGHLYMPAFSVPYAGRKIAEKLGVEFESLWGEAFAKNLGAAKAELLLRYGLQMKTPNAQNWLIQLDKNFRPTGRIYMRDVADSNYVGFVAPYTGAQVQMINDKKSNYTIMTNLEPFWENSVWQMNEGGVDSGMAHRWGQQHDRAYIETITSELNLIHKFETISALEKFLKSEDGKISLSRYLLRQRIHFAKPALQAG